MSSATKHDPAREEFLREFHRIDEEIRNFPFAESDGEPLDTPWHRACINLLIDSILCRFHDRDDFYVGGNSFIYFSEKQAKTHDYKGPDFFFVKDVNLRPERKYWVTWMEGGRLPDVIIELLSPTTEREDRTTKFKLYERTFHTPNYFLYDPFAKKLEGWELTGRRYKPLRPNEHGRLWSSELGLWVGTWDGEYLRDKTTWLRFYDPDGKLVLVGEELARQQAEAASKKAKAERRKAKAERERAEAAEAEVARLKALLGRKGNDRTSP